MVIKMLLIGSHVSFKKETGLLGSLEEALSYNSTTFMYYTGAPQNSKRLPLDKDLIEKAHEKMKAKGIDISKVIVHAPYIINLANDDIEKHNFAVSFLKEECKRCETLGTLKLVLHPGSHVGCGTEKGIKNIIEGLNEVLGDTKTTILLETMAGKGTELGTSIEQIKEIIEGVKYNNIGICLDTCHLSDSGYDMKEFDSVLEKLESYNLLDKVLCIHINDSKNPIGAHKDRHENIGFGYIGFDTLISIIYNEKLKDIPKILETPYINDKAPYKEEIEMIKSKKFNPNLKEEL